MAFVNSIFRRAKALTDTFSLYRTYHRLFDSTDGKVVLRDIMRMGYVTTSANSKDPTEMIKNEGKRELAMAILSKAREKDQSKLMKEIQEGIEEDEQELAHM